ncbi:MAG: divergent polysaccharide deacetylase family protein [Fidelibacterota bacterium]
MTRKRDKGLSLLFILVLGLLTLILYYNLKEDQIIKEVTSDTPLEEVRVRGIICFIIDDFGYNISDVVRSFIHLDIPLTCSILPGHPYSRRIARLAHEARHQVIVHMPMETHDHRAGEESYIITRAMTEEEIRTRVRSAFQKLPQAEGMNNHQGSLATENRRVMQILADELKSLGKYFIDSRTTKKTLAEEVMKAVGVPTERRRIFLDNENDLRYIKKQIEQLARIAKSEGVAIGIGHPRKKTLQAIRQMIPVLREQGFHFGYASAAVN